MTGRILNSAGSSRWAGRHQATVREGSYNLRVFLRDPLATAGVCLILLIIVIGISAPWIAPYPGRSGSVTNVASRLQAPDHEHWFGTDELGRDVFSRVLFGARIPLLVAITVIACCIAIGVPLGGIAGYYGGKVDEIIMRVTDVFLAFPPLLLAIAFVAFLGASLQNAVLALVVSWWPWYARIVRGVAVSVRERPFVEAATTMNVSNLRIVFRHILPAAAGPITIEAAMDVGAVALQAAALSFIGLGAQPPTAEWGLMINEGRAYIMQQWWMAAFPAFAVFIFVLSATLIGDGLRDVLDPRSKR